MAFIGNKKTKQFRKARINVESGLRTIENKSQYIRIPDNVNQNVITNGLDFSISFFVVKDRNNGTFLEKLRTNINPDNQIGWSIGSFRNGGIGRIRFSFYSGLTSQNSSRKIFSFDTSQFDSNINFDNSSWTHYCFVYDSSGNTMQCFYNGISLSEENGFPLGFIDSGIGDIKEPLNVARSNVNSIIVFEDLLINNITIYNKKLNENEIKFIKNTGGLVLKSAFSSITAHYPMTQRKGNIIYDVVEQYNYNKTVSDTDDSGFVSSDNDTSGVTSVMSIDIPNLDNFSISFGYKQSDLTPSNPNTTDDNFYSFRNYHSVVILTRSGGGTISGTWRFFNTATGTEVTQLSIPTTASTINTGSTIIIRKNISTSEWDFIIDGFIDRNIVASGERSFEEPYKAGVTLNSIGSFVNNVNWVTSGASLIDVTFLKNIRQDNNIFFKNPNLINNYAELINYTGNSTGLTGSSEQSSYNEFYNKKLISPYYVNFLNNESYFIIPNKSSFDVTGQYSFVISSNIPDNQGFVLYNKSDSTGNFLRGIRLRIASLNQFILEVFDEVTLNTRDTNSCSIQYTITDFFNMISPLPIVITIDETQNSSKPVLVGTGNTACDIRLYIGGVEIEPNSLTSYSGFGIVRSGQNPYNPLVTTGGTINTTTGIELAEDISGPSSNNNGIFGDVKIINRILSRSEINQLNNNFIVESDEAFSFIIGDKINDVSYFTNGDLYSDVTIVNSTGNNYTIIEKESFFPKIENFIKIDSSVNQKVDINSLSGFTDTEEFTLIIPFRENSQPTGNRYLFAANDGGIASTNNFILLLRQSGTTIWSFQARRANAIIPISLLLDLEGETLNSINVIVFRAKSNQADAILNGDILFTQTNASEIPNLSEFTKITLGGFTSNGFNFDGFLGRCMFFDRFLSIKEIIKLSNNTLLKNPINKEKLRLYSNFNAPSGNTIIEDLSGNGNNGTLVGFTTGETNPNSVDYAFVDIRTIRNDSYYGLSQIKGLQIQQDFSLYSTLGISGNNVNLSFNLAKLINSSTTGTTTFDGIPISSGTTPVINSGVLLNNRENLQFEIGDNLNYGNTGSSIFLHNGSPYRIYFIFRYQNDPILSDYFLFTSTTGESTNSGILLKINTGNSMQYEQIVTGTTVFSLTGNTSLQNDTWYKTQINFNGFNVSGSDVEMFIDDILVASAVTISSNTTNNGSEYAVGIQNIGTTKIANWAYLIVVDDTGKSVDEKNTEDQIINNEIRRIFNL